MAANAPLPDAPTLREILLEYLDYLPANADRLKGTPRMYMGLPVDLSNLDAPICGYVMKGSKKISS